MIAGLDYVLYVSARDEALAAYRLLGSRSKVIFGGAA